MIDDAVKTKRVDLIPAVVSMLERGPLRYSNSRPKTSVWCGVRLSVSVLRRVFFVGLCEVV
jgi:hypothetical protein